MPEREITVVDESKRISCGDAHLTLHIGPHGFVRLSSVEWPIGEIGNLVAVLMKARGIATNEVSDA